MFYIHATTRFIFTRKLLSSTEKNPSIIHGIQRIPHNFFQLYDQNIHWNGISNGHQRSFFETSGYDSFKSVVHIMHKVSILF